MDVYLISTLLIHKVKIDNLLFTEHSVKVLNLSKSGRAEIYNSSRVNVEIYFKVI